MYEVDTNIRMKEKGGENLKSIVSNLPLEAQQKTAHR